MSVEDLLKIPNIPFSLLIQNIELEKNNLKSIQKNKDIQDELKSRISKALIINIYLLNSECIKLGSGSMLKVTDIINISDTFITIKYDSHETNVFYTSILKIEYFYKDGGV